MNLQTRTRRLLVLRPGERAPRGYRGFVTIGGPSVRQSAFAPVLALTAGESLDWLTAFTGYVLVTGKMPSSELHRWMIALRECIPAEKSAVLLRVVDERDGIVLVKPADSAGPGGVLIGWVPPEEVLAARRMATLPSDEVLVGV